MKKLLPYLNTPFVGVIVAFLLVMAGVYAAVGFVMWSMDPSLWPGYVRLIAIGIIVAYGIYRALPDAVNSLDEK